MMPFQPGMTPPGGIPLNPSAFPQNGALNSPGMQPAPQEDLNDPTQLIAALKELAGGMPQTSAIYPPWFKPPKKPTAAEIKVTADRLWEQNRLWRTMIDMTHRWINQDLTGAFPEDVEDRQAGFQEEFISSALSDERNLMISKAATLKPTIRKDVWSTDLKGHAQKVEDAALWMREQFALQHASAGNRPLQIDESSLLVDYGMFCARQTFAADNPDFPLDRALIDPAQVYPVWNGRRGLKAVYRVYRDCFDNIQATYGSTNSAAMKKLTDTFGTDMSADVELPVYEYWDEWWRCVLVGDIEIIPVTDHRYGETPWTIQYGGMGDPMFTRAANLARGEFIDGRWRTVGSNAQNDRLSKSVPMLYYRLRSHDLYESIMARLVTGFKKEIHPPLIRERSNEAAEKAMPEFDYSPGAQNETFLGEERVTAVPTATGGPVTQMLLGGLATDRSTGSMPLSAYGQNDKSNVTGVAVNSLADAGMDKLVPLIKPLEYAYAGELGRGLRLIRNFGDMAKYGGNAITPLYVPKRTKLGGPGGFELTPETIDKAGSQVVVTFTRVDPRDWVNLFNAGKIGVDAGFVSAAEIRAIAVGEHDYERFFEEWMNEKSMKQALELPEFAKAFTVPMAIAEQIKANDGDPAMQELFMKMLSKWFEISQPAPQMPPGMPQGGQPTPPPGGAPQPSGLPDGVQAGPQTAGLSLPGLGQGPGVNQAPVGRPGGL